MEESTESSIYKMSDANNQDILHITDETSVQNNFKMSDANNQDIMYTTDLPETSVQNNLKMSDANSEDIVYTDLLETSTGEKRKREPKLRSKAWEHFTRKYENPDECLCNYCKKTFSSSSRSGTTHLRRHITEVCPVYKKKEKEDTFQGHTSRTLLRYVLGSSDQGGKIVPWKYHQELGHTSTQQSNDLQDELLEEGLEAPQRLTSNTLTDDYGSQTPPPPPMCRQLSQEPTLKFQPREKARMDGLGSCVYKPVELVNGRIPRESSAAATPPRPPMCSQLPQEPTIKFEPREKARMDGLDSYVYKPIELVNGRIPRENSAKAREVVAPPDYSIAAALKCLNEMKDIPQSSEMYLDAFEILEDAGTREGFICLNPEPRRRWLQRLLKRRYPSCYN